MTPPDPGTSTASWTPSPLELRRRAVRRSRSLRHALVAAVSSVVVIGALVLVVISSPGWPTVKATFFDVTYAREVFPIILRALKTNIVLAVVCGASITVLSLVVALVRTTRSAALTPLRILATMFVDLFRGLPVLLVLFLFAFGIPALGITGLTINPVIWGSIALIMTYSAYVAEVFRAGILSVHPSQRAAARSLGLSQGQTLRYVVLPQAVRRVIPPLLNDFVSLLKDTSLLSVVGVVEALRAAQIEASKTFNYTPYVVAAVLFLILTVPLTRITDRFLQRSIARQNAQGNA